MFRPAWSTRIKKSTMNKRFTVTIHDLNGVKQYNLHQVIKKVLVYFIVSILLLIAIGAGVIAFLNVALEEIELKKSQLEELNSGLLAKQEELSIVADRLEDIETMIGLAPQNESSLTERVEIATLTSSQRAALLKYIPNGSPVPYKGITSKYGYRTHPTLNRREFHRGTDLRAAMNTEIYATADGVIEFAGLHNRSGYGRLIILDHNYGFKTYYGHMNKILVNAGQYVKKGEVIGLSGNSGMSNGPHLHYEVRFTQRVLNPFLFMKWDVENYTKIFEKEKNVPWQSLITAITQDHQIEKPGAAPLLLSQKVLLSRAK